MEPILKLQIAGVNNRFLCVYCNICDKTMAGCKRHRFTYSATFERDYNCEVEWI